MDRRKIILAVLVLLVALAVPMLGQTAPDSRCMGNRNVGGWSTETIPCTLATAGDSLSIRATIGAAGAYTSFPVPYPSIVNARVTIKTLDGATVLSCSHTDVVLAHCGDAMRLGVPAGTRLLCVASGWTNMHHGLHVSCTPA